ncbi:MAG: hypothetical protein LUC24_05935 [Bacteroidales bacterium]|nr:hypothetical protein [Bacteroidales bacterium]
MLQESLGQQTFGVKDNAVVNLPVGAAIALEALSGSGTRLGAGPLEDNAGVGDIKESGKIRR